MKKMTHALPLLAALAAATFAVHTAPVAAGPGHDHADEKPAAAARGTPRFNAHSDLFEMVGVVNRTGLTLYLDRYADNAPVTAGAIELEIKPAQGVALKLQATPSAEGVFAAVLAQPLAPGAYAITATVSAALDGKTETDLLAATLDIAPDQLPGNRTHQRSSEYVAMGAALAAILAGMAWWKLRRRRSLPAFGGVR